MSCADPRPRLWEADDAAHDCFELVQKLLSKTCRLRLVPLRSLSQFAVGNAE